MRSRPSALLLALALASVVVAAPAARAYESIRRDSPLGLHLAEIARRTGVPLEVMLGPHAWKPRFVVPYSAERDARRATEMARLQAEMDAATDETPPIVFARPPVLDSLPFDPSGQASSTATGDLDGDGLTDIVAIQGADSVLSVRLAIAADTYAPPVYYPLASGAYKVVLGDFNGDGRPDVAVANQASPLSRQFSVLLNLGDGTFGPRFDGDLSFPPYGGVPMDILVADFGRDGHADLMFSSFMYARIDVVRSRADGSFEPAEALQPQPEAYIHGITAMAVGDLDGDLNPDVLLAYPHGDCFYKCKTLSVFYGRDDGTFEPATDYLAYAPGAPDDIDRVEVRDQDGDRRSDILVWLINHSDPTYYAMRPSLLRNAGGRRFEAPAVRDIGRTPNALAAGRFRAGALEDLVVSDGATVTFVRNRGDGTFAPESSLADGSLMSVADLNSDGLNDVLVARADTLEIRVADGAGGFLSSMLVMPGRFLTLADFTGDRRPDLAVILPDDDIGVLAGNGAGGFGPPADFGPTGALRFPLAAVDLDGDGLADLEYADAAIASGSENDSLRVRWGTGRGFTDPSVFDLGPARPYGDWTIPMDLAAGDFNGDGLRDLAVVKGYGQSGINGHVRMLPGLGHRTLGSPSPPLPAGEDSYRGVVADFDGDGFDDLVVDEVATDGTGRFEVFRGHPDESGPGLPGLSSVGVYFVRHWALSIATGDFNGDGRPDVAVGCGSYSYSGAAVLVLPNLSPVSSPTPALASLESVNAMPDQVSLVWDLGGSRAAIGVVERRVPSSEWTRLASFAPDGAGRVRFDDRDVGSGARYGYRLKFGGAQSLTTAETWVDVPLARAFALDRVQPNPTVGPLTVAFSLSTTTRATLDVIDVTGRRVRSATLESPTIGRHQLSLATDGTLAPGLYFVRLVQGHRSTQSRVAVIR